MTCFDEWRVGRFIRSITHGYITGDGQSLILPSRTNRVGVLITCVDDITASQSAVQVTGATVGTGLFTVSANTGPFMLSLRDHGDLVTKTLTLNTVGTASLLATVVEFEVTEDMLALPLDRFETEYGKRGY